MGELQLWAAQGRLLTLAASEYGHSLINENQILHLKQKQIKIN